jgi:hypothetical protein
LLIGVEPVLAGEFSGRLEFAFLNYEAPEGSGSLQVEVFRRDGADGAISVGYETFSGTARAGLDFVATEGRLEWADGDAAGKSFTVPILDDDQLEPAEDFRLRLVSPLGGAILDEERSVARVTIPASDLGGGGPDLPVGTLRFADPVYETEEEDAMALLVVERTEGTAGRVTVEVATIDGTAEVGSGDYSPLFTELLWEDGEGGPQPVVVIVRDDDLEEDEEFFRVSLSNPTGGAEIDPEGEESMVIILPSDGPQVPDVGGVLRFSAGAYQALESSGAALLGVERVGSVEGDVAVRVRVVGGTAAEGVDFTLEGDELAWEAGDAEPKVISLTLTDDDENEGNERLELILEEATGGAVVDPQRGRATLAILDDDFPDCLADANSLCLLGGRFRVRVAWESERASGLGTAVPLSDRSALFWFFEPSNVEVLVKMIDACDGFGRFWFFASATTNLGLTLTVTDTSTEESITYRNALGQAALPILDTTSFIRCP